MMQPHPRYEILEEIAAGDFATVYRGLDKELNREVAIKQIHTQFLADEKQLDRYWKEAQTLASLEHPNIMTIYDIALDRGWLILELMQGSLHQRAAGQPMDLNFLRVALVCSLQALKFLHGNGIVHGDVKPSNMLLDKRNWVKLGDFGLAQRVENDEGSLLKGTTKYMAPERVSDQFGPVGPASDLYSLGFSIYELMCGESFDTLFPGLSAFGRNKQIAWMMWQSAGDRQLPEIGRVLEGVPDDMVHVIQRLATKDPEERYQTADEAIYDLKMGLKQGASGPSPQELEAQAAHEEAAQKKKQRTILTIAMAVSLLLTLVVVLDPFNLGEKPTAVNQDSYRPRPAQGAVIFIDRKEEKLTIRTAKKREQAIRIRPNDLVFLNGVVAKKKDIVLGDELVVEVNKDKYQTLNFTRLQQDTGLIKSIDRKQNSFVLLTKDKAKKPIHYTIMVPEEVTILFNEAPTYKDERVTVADLEKNDRVLVRHDRFKDKKSASKNDRVARTLRVKRVVSSSGIFQGLTEGELTFALEDNKDFAGDAVSFPLASNVKVEINGQKYIRGEPIVAADLLPEDVVTVHHDTHVVRIEAERILEAVGTIESLDSEEGTLVVGSISSNDETTYAVDPELMVNLGGIEVALQDLHTGDRVELTYDAVDLQHLRVMKLKATRPVNRDRWAVLIAVADYDDRTMNALAHTKSDVQLLRDTLVQRYAVASDQVITLINPTREEFGDRVKETLGRVNGSSDLLVYYGGHAYRNSKGIPYLTTKDFIFTDMDDTGAKITDFIKLVESCAAKNKLVLLDTAHDEDAFLSSQPSSHEMFAAAQQTVKGPMLKSTEVVVSCDDGQRGERREDGYSRFAYAISRAIEGKGDSTQDNRVSVQELVPYVNDLVRIGSDGRQSPIAVEPKKIIPKRFTAEARKAVERLAAAFTGDGVNLEEIDLLYDEATQLAPDQPEPKLLYVLALLKAKTKDSIDEADLQLRELRRAHPENLLAIRAAIWRHFIRRGRGTHVSVINDLVLLVGTLPKDSEGKAKMSTQAKSVFRWAGRLREYTASAAAENRRPPATALEQLDDVVQAEGKVAQAYYQSGRKKVKDKMAAFDKKIAATNNRGKKATELRRRRLISYYTTFSIERAVKAVLAGMDN